MTKALCNRSVGLISQLQSTLMMRSRSGTVEGSDLEVAPVPGEIANATDLEET